MPPSGWTTPCGGGLSLITDITVDTPGRTIQALGPCRTIDMYEPVLSSVTWSETSPKPSDGLAYRAQLSGPLAGLLYCLAGKKRVHSPDERVSNLFAGLQVALL